MARKNPSFLTGFGLLWIVLDYVLVGDLGLEPRAFGFGGQRSIHLS